MVYFYDVVPVSKLAIPHDSLCYQYDAKLPIGSIVKISLRNKELLGVVWDTTTKPNYKTKEIISPVEGLYLGDQRLELLKWLHKTCPGPVGAIAALFIPSILTNYTEKPLVYTANTDVLPPLTKEQSMAVKQIKDQRVSWLFGETGSGKTRVYLEFVAEILSSGSQALILSPEIGLSSQLHSEFSKYFGDTVGHWHSNLTQKQRNILWHEVRQGKKQIIVGPRSSLFLPYDKLGLIVVDEAHDDAYKQDQHPRYNTLRVAEKITELTNAKVIFGTATPPASELWLAQRHKSKIVRMNNLAVNGQKQISTEVIVDSDKVNFSTSDIFCDKAVKLIKNTYNQGRQSLVLLNRRGTARLVRCSDCGWRAICDHCGNGLVFHHDSFDLMCHICGTKSKLPTSCPKCQNTDILFSSWGSKAALEEVKRILPQARVARFDSDNLTSDKLEKHYDSIKNGDYDVIVGTQMLSKGFDLPLLASVIILQADSGLLNPDYRSSEKTFQLIKQVSGRVGRGHIPGSVIVQAKNPELPAIKDAMQKNYRDFYTSELEYRKSFGLPPFRQTAKLWTIQKTSQQAEALARKMKSWLDSRPNIEVVGPSPAIIEKTSKGYKWQIVVFSTSKLALYDISKDLPSNWIIDIDPLNLL